MNPESVIEFLGCVPLLQTLPSSSHKKIAEVVFVKRYDQGDSIVCGGDGADGIYFIWEGEAEVCGSLHSDDKSHAEYHLKQYDFFGHGMSPSTQPVDVLALSKLTCLVLPNDQVHLLKPKSIWSADDAQEKHPLIERILQLDPIEVDVFQGITLPDAIKHVSVFGGQFLGQALAAACKTVDSQKIVHSLHAYFILPGDLSRPIIYKVHRVRDGKSFATRRVEAIQREKVLFTLMVSFQNEEQLFIHQVVAMPSVPDPEKLISREELQEQRLVDPRIPRTYRIEAAGTDFFRWPIELRFCEPDTAATNYKKSRPSLRYWFRARGILSDDQALHRCIVAYASDLFFLEVSLHPHYEKDLKSTNVSLDHSMWFHKPLRADDWLLYVIDSPISHSGRGFVNGRMFTRTGEQLVVSIAQEGLLRRAREPAPAPASASKL
ncbi:acyl-coenzyme A thioesterase 8-like isoform X1 [Salvia splendens]|uniref:acyl-coenzyme A thioesterase 8-like isoform X1 n=1 Tax=Salvia splendens TaxID=180675 RepID=UPI001C26298A|nr:acyl-coenzyme A thioesterase 8-like isoform X1 [Salvia splendens]